MVGGRPSIESTSGFCIWSKNWRAYAERLSMYLRWPSAKMVSNASELLPLPLTPVITTRQSRGMVTSTPLRLCSRAPRIRMERRSAGCGFARAMEVRKYRCHGALRPAPMVMGGAHCKKSESISPAATKEPYLQCRIEPTFPHFTPVRCWRTALTLRRLRPRTVALPGWIARSGRYSCAQRGAWCCIRGAGDGCERSDAL